MFRAYVTDALQAIAENTAMPAAWLTDGKSGKLLSRRWIEKDKPAPPEETRTADEVIDHIRRKLASL